MTYLLIGLFLFLGTHSISIIAPEWRATMVNKMGNKAWKVFYSIVAIVGVFLIIKGYQLAGLDPRIIYQPPHWTRHITFLLMLPVFPMLFAAYLPGRIQSTLKHPMLVAVKTWALAHLISNGMLADLLLFGSFLVWAVADRISLKKRPAKTPIGAPPGKYNDLIAVVGGLTVYVLFLIWGHKYLIGMPLISG